ncbi:MAG TPA: T9SS type A sorting domain-containing protein, partial [Bacteroidia bacterium]|nr:T9SS type A sorting domain-containing protein [Bacteroidia bacterium]
DSTELTATFIGGAQYLWNTGNPADNQQKLWVKQSGSYSATVTNSGGCKATSPAVNIVVKSKPLVSLSSSAANDSACSTDSITFTATAGHDTYNFMVNGVTKQNTSSNTYRTKLVPADVVSVIATKAGCASLAADKNLVIITPLPAPVISCGTATTSSVTFNWGAVSNATGYEVSTNNGANWVTPSSGATGTSHQVTGLGFSTNVTLLVRALSAGPCAFGSSGQQSCSSLPCSGVTFTTILGDTLICPGDSTTITIGNISAPNFALKFNNGAFATDTVFWVQPNITTSYPFELVDSANLVCPPATFNADVKVDNVPALNVGYSPANEVCQGAPVQITSSTGFATYTLHVNGLPSALTNSTGAFSFSAVTGGVPLNVVAQTVNGCEASSPDKAFTVNPLPNVGFTANVNNKMVTFDDTTANAVTWDWDFGDNSGTATTKNPTYTYATVGSFDVKLIVTDNNLCVDSATQQITTANVSTGEIEGLNRLEVYPNPTTGKVKLDLNWQGNGVITIKVTDITGRTISTETITETGVMSREINLTALPGGTYLVHIQAESGEKVIKLLKHDK